MVVKGEQLEDPDWTGLSNPQKASAARI